MDIQMPHMNGLQATKEILEMAKDEGKDAPHIIGLTSYTNKK